jgi:hypothetical protein
MVRGIASTIFLAFFCVQSNAFCSKPRFLGTEPISVPETPDTPPCMIDMKLSGSHSCDDWQIQDYISRSNSYIDDLNNYSLKAKNFAIEAVEFAKSAAKFADCRAVELQQKTGN